MSPLSSPAMANTYGSLLFRVSCDDILTQHVARWAVRLRKFTTWSCHNCSRLIAAQEIRIMRADKSAVHSSAKKSNRSLVDYLRADQQQPPCWLSVDPIQCQELQTLWKSVESEACPRDHAILLESVVVHDLEPGSQCICQLICARMLKMDAAIGKI
jgi:hypothetical protein